MHLYRVSILQVAHPVAPQACRSPLNPTQQSAPDCLYAGNKQDMQAAGAVFDLAHVLLRQRDGTQIQFATQDLCAAATARSVAQTQIASQAYATSCARVTAGQCACWSTARLDVTTFVDSMAGTATSYVCCSLQHNISLATFCLSPKMVVKTPV